MSSIDNKKLINSIKEIDTIIELNEGKVLSKDDAIDIYGITNDLISVLKRLPKHIVCKCSCCGTNVTDQNKEDWLCETCYENNH